MDAIFFRFFFARFYWQMTECRWTFVLAFSLYELYSRFIAKWQLNSLTRLISYCDCNFVLKHFNLLLCTRESFSFSPPLSHSVFMLVRLLYYFCYFLLCLFMCIRLAPSVICLSKAKILLRGKCHENENKKKKRKKNTTASKIFGRQSVFSAILSLSLFVSSIRFLC